MTKRDVMVALAALATATAIGACKKPPAKRPLPTTIGERVVADFEAAVKQGEGAYVAMFDVAATGVYASLLRRHDLNGRRTGLDDKLRVELAAEDGAPDPAERAQAAVTAAFAPIAQRTVGRGGCRATPPRTEYGKLLGVPFDPLPDAAPPKYVRLRDDVNRWLERGGVVGVQCAGGQGGLALVFTGSDAARGYDLIAVHDD